VQQAACAIDVLAWDGYRNAEGRTELSQKHGLGRFNHWIEPDSQRAVNWREAWDLLLTDKLTLDEIAGMLPTTTTSAPCC
jgi:hypothetical protein